MLKSFVVCIAFTLLSGQVLGAQLAVNPRLVLAIRDVSPGTLLRIETQGTHIGRLVRTSPDSILLAEEDAERQVAYRDVRVVSVTTRQARKGAAIGGVTAAVIGAALGLLVANVVCERSCSPEGYLAMAGLGAGTFGAGGVLLGAGLGLLSHGWRPIYPPE